MRSSARGFEQGVTLQRLGAQIVLQPDAVQIHESLHVNVVVIVLLHTNWIDPHRIGGLRNCLCFSPRDDVTTQKRVLAGQPQGKLYEERHVRHVFQRVLRRANLPRFRLYDLRHSFASLLLSSNMPLLYVSKQLGHANPMTTLRYYARWVLTGHSRYVDALDTAAEKNLAPSVGTKAKTAQNSLILSLSHHRRPMMMNH